MGHLRRQLHEYRTFTIPQHAGFDATESNIESLRESLDEAYAKFQGTWEEPEQINDGPMGGPMSSNNFIADDTLEGLAAQMGLGEEQTAAFLRQVADYNQYCADGADQQFGRNAQVLFPVDKAPFHAVEFNPSSARPWSPVAVSSPTATSAPSTRPMLLFPVCM